MTENEVCVIMGPDLGKGRVVATLRALPLFECLAENELAHLAASVGLREVQEGQVLFQEGDDGDEAYVVMSGGIDLVLESMDGTQLTVTRVERCGYFGEMALIDDRPRSTTAIACRNSEVLIISRRDLLALLSDHPGAMLTFLCALSARVRVADEKIKTLGFLDVAGRLAKTLLELDMPQADRKTILISQEHLAAMVGSRRQTVSLILSQWRRGGVIASGGDDW